MSATQLKEVQSRDGKVTGRVVGAKACTMEGCRCRRIGVRWPDGTLTWPSSKGMDFLSDTKARLSSPK